ncbi:dTDP-4-dehydrorhamnose reductase [Paenibacillus ginsengarvi]|uniref:dTDP-4-dehydrorhamnose reductase n=1 Tax=Paenibacillus ginsengarvi TaxID=400777 RepID=A0A3B0CEQ2_9BACL|nr:dTDP-4-dehydrorhamnose reductase [Paenibacillus ginsengarvi]RKN82177.1 dTDP-4-dehydrorhamnose reductase [Paenibacillus ginsengarvi]
MRILVTGAHGQVGKELVTLLERKYEIYGYGRDELDITNEDQCKLRINEIKPDVVVHCAAYTAVDLAEGDKDSAYKINAFGTRNLVVPTEAIGAKFCYLSTDYVFDGLAKEPYNEFDNTNPQNIYGKSKRAGELLVQSLSSKFFIVRTSWIFGLQGSNFVKTMINISSRENTVRVVNDQIGSPTYTVDLVRFLAQLIITNKYGIYHVSNTGNCSWYELACAIFEELGISIEVEPCTTDDFPKLAPRPKYSVMDHSFVRINGFEELPHWRTALRSFIQELRE